MLLCVDFDVLGAKKQISKQHPISLLALALTFIPQLWQNERSGWPEFISEVLDEKTYGEESYYENEEARKGISSCETSDLFSG